MNDLISREAAINTVYSMLRKWDTEDPEDLKNMLLLAFQELPSAQPTEASCWGCNCQKMERLKEQKTFSEMVHLHDAETHEKRTEERTEKHACDLIDRQAAIDSIGEVHPLDYNGQAILERIKALPSAEKVGKWIIHSEVKNIYGGTYIECSECGEKYVVQYIEDEKFCRNCGARMQEGEENERPNQP